MLVSKAWHLSPLFRASFGNHGLGEQGPLRHPHLWLHQDPGVWLWLHRFPQPALRGYQANCKHLPMDSSSIDATVRLWRVYIKSWTVPSASHCRSRVRIPGDPMANVFAMSRARWSSSALSRTGSMEMQSCVFLPICSVGFCLTLVWFGCTVGQWSLKSQYYFSFCASAMGMLGCSLKLIWMLSVAVKYKASSTQLEAPMWIFLVIVQYQVRSSNNY